VSDEPLHPLLQESIELQPFGDFAVRQCGCEMLHRTGRMRLCAYHEGYADAIDAMERQP
jgi:hypothetical protein